MVDESSLVSKTSSINCPFAVEIEEERKKLSVIDNSSAVGFKK
jgi:hypothetical protein